jgi:hypothetical protein
MVDFLKSALHHHVAEEMDHLERKRRQQQQPSTKGAGSSNSGDDNGSSADLALALERAFLITDIHAKHLGISSSGATVAVALIKVGWLG